jgi:predicted ATPase
MGETLIIEKLGPIKRLEIKPRPLTIIIGEQASGKSLVAQLLYFFRGLESHLASIYNNELTRPKNWHASAIRGLLDDLRGVPFGHFAVGTASLHYLDKSKQIDWKVNVKAKDLSTHPSRGLIDAMTQWVDLWEKDNAGLGKVEDWQVYIPTERSMITRLSDTQPQVLYAPYQPLPLRRFASLLTQALSWRQRADNLQEDSSGRSHDQLRKCEERALAGHAVYSVPTRKWQWSVVEGEFEKTLPITATSSGQMEAWPFFAVASRIARFGPLFLTSAYFEEPETHLHPSAQVEVMRAIAYLVNRGHSFVVTTHSPFIGYVIDNMMQRFISYKGDVPEGQVALNPDDVAAYRLRQDPEKPPEDIMDRENTKLLKLDELEGVADELEEEFDQLLDMME